MTQEIKIEKKSSEVIQPVSKEDARESICTRKDLSGASLQGMQLENLNAVGAILRKTDLSDANLSHSLLINPNFYKASLNRAAMHNTVLLSGDLVKTSFNQTDLTESAFVGVNAQNASFSGANLQGAGLVGSNLKDTDFSNADLTNARLASLNVSGADFTGARLTNARALNVDWSRAKVPPDVIPEPFIKLPGWAWPLIVGSIMGIVALAIYALIRKHKKPVR